MVLIRETCGHGKSKCFYGYKGQKIWKIVLYKGRVFAVQVDGASKYVLDYLDAAAYG